MEPQLDQHCFLYSLVRSTELCGHRWIMTVQKWAEELHQKCLLRDPYREFNKNIPFNIKAKINGQQCFHTTCRKALILYQQSLRKVTLYQPAA